ncbi:MAG: glycosyltransferase family protein [Planctomycetota bacterium]
MKTVAIIQARMGSSRLPGKVMAEIYGQTMLERVVGRVAIAKQINDVVVATTDKPDDDAIESLCRTKGWRIFRGEENDVLSRFLGAAGQSGAAKIVRITADCPLIDPHLIDIAVESLDPERLDYVSNVWPKRTFPRGLDVEAFTLETLVRADLQAKTPAHREHVTSQVYSRPDRFRIGGMEYPVNNSDLRWTVDTPDDLKLIRTIYGYFEGRRFQTSDIVRACREHPAWQMINHHVQQKVA